MRALILLVTWQCAFMRHGLQEASSVEPTSPVRVVEPIPSVGPREPSSSEQPTQGRNLAAPSYAICCFRPMGNAWRWSALTTCGPDADMVHRWRTAKTQRHRWPGQPASCPTANERSVQDKDYGNTFVVELATGQKSPVPDPLGNFLFASEDTAIVPLISHSWDRPEPFQLSLFDTRGGKKPGIRESGNDNRVRYSAH